jgi:hypothetical protein
METRLSFDHLGIFKHDIFSDNPQFRHLESRGLNFSGYFSLSVSLKSGIGK